ncbi:hypothetical protein M3638_01215 [Oceanobacillus profundus]|uniref:hypothetical protein n=1 Tax=Oceanobacillus profundus TaxID=372463 RepID=UPI0020421198|nr:hypothetical protein [Oceanobacillus profundus]MCM3396454.1 hypothetical protein [Oceanobacillus profundus]
MEALILSQVFNPELSGRSVRIKGHDIDGEEWDRLFLVKSVEGEHINLVNNQGEIIEDVHIENFLEPATDLSFLGLRLTVLEEK